MRMAQWRATLAGKPVPITREGLTAHYDFDGSLTDSSGGYQHGRTLKGDPGFGAGQVSRPQRLMARPWSPSDRSGDLKSDQPFTMAFWLKYGGSKQPMPVFEKIDSPQIAGAGKCGSKIRVLVGIQKRAAHPYGPAVFAMAELIAGVTYERAVYPKRVESFGAGFRGRVRPRVLRYT